MQKINIVIASESYLIAGGLHLFVSEMRGVNILGNVEDEKELHSVLSDGNLHLLIITVGFANKFEIKTNDFLQTHPNLKVLGIIYNGADFSENLRLDSKIDLFQNKDEIAQTFVNLTAQIQEIDNRENESFELSNREKDVLKHVAMGMPNKEIADKLFISLHTVLTHRKNITKKLGIKTISGLTVYAIINGLLGIEEIEKG